MYYTISHEKVQLLLTLYLNPSILVFISWLMLDVVNNNLESTHCEYLQLAVKIKTFETHIFHF